MYVTYQDLIQMAIFIVALIGLIYQILKEKEKKQPPLPQIATADDPVRGLKEKCYRVEPLLWLPFLYIYYSTSGGRMQEVFWQCMCQVFIGTFSLFFNV